MGSKMLIDAAHPEETRVVVVRNKRVEDFDYESASRKQLRGNIYLAKVTRVEPSLQAAFVDYGGNRHGFLAFSEIHPDYYQIPVADRQALLEEEVEEQIQAEAEQAEEDESQPLASTEEADDSDEADEADPGSPSLELEQGGNSGESLAAEGDAFQPETGGAVAEDGEDVEVRQSRTVAAAIDGGEAVVEEPAGADVAGPSSEEVEAGHGEEEHASGRRHRPRRSARHHDDADNGGNDSVDSVGSEDALEELPERVRRRRRNYKIQEVIKRRQIILVQVVKEERGNKGAALTTYLSLAGRYTVLMPNTGRGGGISRKISNPSDRKRLRAIANELEVPEGMGLIIRTAGASRTKAEIKRDYDYLLRLWENVRDLTLRSTAPALVYEEGNLLKRSIRDLYSKEIDEILVAGEDAYKEAKDFMRMLMPSHAKNVKLYKEPEPIFLRYGVERQLSALFSPYVTLKSGGYIVINQTEALVSIDVNSGKATREHNIEDTALKTNLEAAEEIARQLRLRDLAGLIVIDFIDMDERRNNRAVERKLKECLRNDRARIQVGRISHFGLLEMSRQRLRAGMLEGTTTPCSMCQGTGVVRSTESVSLDVLRSIEDMLMTDGVSHLVATAPVDVALYILNHKRYILRDIEQRYGIGVVIDADERLHGGNFRIEKAAGVVRETGPAPAQMDARHLGEEEAAAHEAEAEAAERSPVEEEAESSEGGRRRRRRRRRRRGDRAEAATDADTQVTAQQDGSSDAEVALGGEDLAAPQPEQSGQRKARRRGRRGGRRGRGERGELAAQASDSTDVPPTPDQPQGGQVFVSEPDDSEPVETEPVQMESQDAGGPQTGERAREEPLWAQVSPLQHEAQPAGNGRDAEPERDHFASSSPPSPPPYASSEPTGEHHLDAEAPAMWPATPSAPVAEEDDGQQPSSAQLHESQESSQDSEEGSRAPVRRGWWQRRLLGSDR